MDINFDILDVEYSKYGKAMLNQEQVNGIFKRLSINQEMLVKDILLVDDATFMRHVIKNMLSENGYFVASEAEDGIMAVKQYRQYRPDLVIMNITMPVLDGIGATRLIKEYNKDANIIMLSGISNYQTIKESILAGACGFISGRFDISKFNGIINSKIYQSVNA